MLGNEQINKQLVAEYLDSLSGQPKTKESMQRFVSDSGLLEHIEQVEAAFPRYELISEGMVAEGDQVAVRAKFRGVQRGAFADLEPTGRQAEAGLMIFYRIREGRIAEHWLQFDLAGLLGQLKGERAA